MAYFPFFIDIKDKKCCVIGGGNVAFRKLEALMEFGADVTVISPEISEDIRRLGGKLHIKSVEYQESDLKEAFFVIAATDNPEVNSKISRQCMDNNILVNVVDEKEKCGFIFPAYIKKGDISIGVTTSGKSPIMSHYIKQIIQRSIPDSYAALVSTLGDYRSLVKKEIEDTGIRAEVFKEIALIGTENNGNLTLEEVVSVIRKYKQ